VAQGSLRTQVEVLEVAEGVAEEIDDVVPVMVVRRRPAEWSEEKLGGIGLRAVGRGRDQTQLVAVAFHHLADHFGSLGRVNPGVVEQDDRHPPSHLGALDEVIKLVGERLGGAAGAKPQEHQPSRQSTAAKPTAFRLTPGARTRRWPARRFRDQTRARVR
jgi:hypothetical protein